MPQFKQSAREKMLRRVAASVLDSMQYYVGTNEPPVIVTEFQDQLDFLTTEIDSDRRQNLPGALDDYPSVKPL